MPVIVIELVLVLGGTIAFAWWQFRDLDREKKKREARERAQQQTQSAGPEED